MRSTLFALGLFTVAAIHPALAQYAAPGTLTSPDRCPGGPMPGTLLRAAILQLPFPLPFRKGWLRTLRAVAAGKLKDTIAALRAKLTLEPLENPRFGGSTARIIPGPLGRSAG
jgi:hypothetical protein